MLLTLLTHIFEHFFSASNAILGSYENYKVRHSPVGTGSLWVGLEVLDYCLASCSLSASELRLHEQPLHTPDTVPSSL